MTNGRDLLYISRDQELALIEELVYKIQVSKPDIHPSRTCFLCVSPDYSGIVTQHLSHALSVDGEIYHIEAVNVPFPDEQAGPYRVQFEINFAEWVLDWDQFVLIEAGVIRGSNYKWITDSMKQFIQEHNIYTVALCENMSSKFKSDFVSLYYDDYMTDLHFWWEKPNNHWPWDYK